MRAVGGAGLWGFNCARWWEERGEAPEVGVLLGGGFVCSSLGGSRAVTDVRKGVGLVAGSAVDGLGLVFSGVRRGDLNGL